MKLTAELMKEFRETSGLCLMECKHWLTLANSEDITAKEDLYAKAIDLEFNSRKYKNRLVDYRKNWGSI